MSGSNSVAEKYDSSQIRIPKRKQNSVEEDSRSTWRKPRDTIADSKLSALLSASQTKTNWELQIENRASRDDPLRIRDDSIGAFIEVRQSQLMELRQHRNEVANLFKTKEMEYIASK